MSNENKVLTLLSLLEENEVCIPIIQRDYAQGRNNEKANEVRKNLIKDIKKCLESNKKIDFNFIYGTVSDKIFYPVDGQQRLTTLYLLHWFLACHCDKLEELTKLHKFSYMTRNSATDFFAILKNPTEHLKEIIKNPKESWKEVKITRKDNNGKREFKKEVVEVSKDLRQNIENEPWFQAEWSYDPTVDSALTMLNDLSKDEDFQKYAEEYYQQLKDGAIFFTQIVETGEDAENKAAKSYIRMNARGKSLEKFENLKAMVDSIEEKIKREFAENTDVKKVDILESFEEQRNESIDVAKESDLRKTDTLESTKKQRKKSIDFIRKYDSEYIDKMYNVFGKNKLEETTNVINTKSLNCLKNIYNLNCQLNWKYPIGDTSSFISNIYEYSQKQLENEEKVFFENYLKMLNSVFVFFSKENKENQIQEIFEEKDLFFASNNREIVALVLYIYAYEKKHKVVVSDEILNKYKYILKNLNYENWTSEFLKNIYSFSESVAGYKDIFVYFVQESLEDIVSVLDDTLLDDIQVRLKEQKIKCEIIAENNCSWDYFKNLEERLEKYCKKYYEPNVDVNKSLRKIQHLLYSSGYWDNVSPSQNNFIQLQNYIELADNYFYNKSTILEWKKVYAIAVHLDNQNQLENEKDINRTCGTKHIWNNKYYFWNDKEEQRVLSKENFELEAIKKAYVQLDTIQQIIKNFTDNQNNTYDECWLKYAIQYAEDINGLLDKKLYWNKNSNIVTLNDYVWYWNGKSETWESIYQKIRYDVYILSQFKNYQIGLRNLSEYAKSKWRFPSGLSGYDLRAYIMHLYMEIPLDTINSLYSDWNCVYYYNSNNETKYEYTIYEAYSPYKFNISKYDITNEKNQQKLFQLQSQILLNQYKEQDYRYIYEKCNRDWNKAGNTHIWIKKGFSVMYRGSKPKPILYELKTK